MDGLFRKLKKILLENIGFERAPGLARDNEEGSRDVDLVFERLHLCRICGIEHMQVGIAGNLAERDAQDLRTQTRPSHAK
jgi:hypothetical protein